MLLLKMIQKIKIVNYTGTFENYKYYLGHNKLNLTLIIILIL